MKNKILPSIVLATICIVVALLLSVVNMVTAPMIEAAKAEKIQKMLSGVLPEGKGRMSASDLARGRAIALGDILSL